MVFTIFDIFWREYDEWFEKHRDLYLSELRAIEYASRGVSKPWLEVGVGSARFAYSLGVEFGVDPSRSLLKLAFLRSIDVVEAVGEYIPFASNVFGGVFMTVTLCFLDNPVQVFREVYRVLKSDGRLVLGFIPLDSDWGRFYKDLKKKGHRFYQYASFYTVEQVVDLLELTRFEPELYVSTLIRSKPSELEVFEEPYGGLRQNAGFVVVRARKRALR